MDTTSVGGDLAAGSDRVANFKLYVFIIGKKGT